MSAILEELTRQRLCPKEAVISAYSLPSVVCARPWLLNGLLTSIFFLPLEHWGSFALIFFPLKVKRKSVQPCRWRRYSWAPWCTVHNTRTVGQQGLFGFLIAQAIVKSLIINCMRCQITVEIVWSNPPDPSVSSLKFQSPVKYLKIFQWIGCWRGSIPHRGLQQSTPV